ncbi:MAG: hypothetical protein ACRCS3_06910 [Paracoccaceae bacterium]
MAPPNIRPGGNLPSRDGEINLYTSREGAAQSWFNHSQRVIFVNGMDNQPKDHVEAASGLSLMMGCPVIGVFNKSHGTLLDIAQCVTDKLRLARVQSSGRTGFEGWVLAVDALHKAGKLVNPGLTRVDLVASLLGNNAASVALYRLLVSGGVNTKSAPIYCHSQGNLITSNALTAVALALGTQAIAGIEVNSFGSPCRYWPPGIKRKNYAFTLDPISLLDLRADMTSSKVGFEVSHGFKYYMARDAEFIINGFRFGGMRMTTNMDEVGLAKVLVKMGSNAPRIRRIFERLRDAHYTDRDDVAVHYVEQSTSERLRSLKQADPKLIDLLIWLLEDGPTMADEERAIAKLKAL